LIIDTHVHLWSQNFLAKPFWDGMIETLSRTSGKPRDAVREKLAAFYDETGELLLQDMDNAGIDQSWICPLDYGLFPKMGECAYPVAELNRKFAEIASRSRGRIVAFVGIDPRRKEAVEILERGVKEWGMKGLKLAPFCGFYPNDENCVKLYAKASDLGIPVLVHTGPEGGSFYSKYCMPIFLDEIAGDFPSLKLIMAHAGFCWWREAIFLARLHQNISVDISGWQPTLLHNAESEFYQPLRTMLDTVGQSKILFGSDWPAYRLFKGGQKNWVKAFSEAPAMQGSHTALSREEINAILSGNAEKLLPKEKER
jgi:predicted TIM-barrel fold metal-dependent hydrolase